VNWQRKNSRRENKTTSVEVEVVLVVAVMLAPEEDLVRKTMGMQIVEVATVAFTPVVIEEMSGVANL
jgi:hypothetical protein